MSTTRYGKLQEDSKLRILVLVKFKSVNFSKKQYESGNVIKRKSSSSLTWSRANAAHALSTEDGFLSIITNLPISAPLSRMIYKS